MRKHKTREEQIANQIAKLVNDVTIDIDEVGRYLADAIPTVSYNRILIMTEAAIDKKERDNARLDTNYLF